MVAQVFPASQLSNTSEKPAYTWSGSAGCTATYWLYQAGPAASLFCAADSLRTSSSAAVGQCPAGSRVAERKTSPSLLPFVASPTRANSSRPSAEYDRVDRPGVTSARSPVPGDLCQGPGVP